MGHFSYPCTNSIECFVDIVFIWILMEAEEWYYVSNGQQVSCWSSVLVVDGAGTIQKSSRGVDCCSCFNRWITSRSELSKIRMYGAACWTTGRQSRIIRSWRSCWSLQKQKQDVHGNCKLDPATSSCPFCFSTCACCFTEIHRISCFLFPKRRHPPPPRRWSRHRTLFTWICWKRSRGRPSNAHYVTWVWMNQDPRSKHPWNRVMCWRMCGLEKAEL